MMIVAVGYILQFSGGRNPFSSETMEPSVTVDGKETPGRQAGNTRNQVLLSGDQDTVIQTKDESYLPLAGTLSMKMER